MLFTHPTVASILQHPFFKHLSTENQERLMSHSHEQQCQAGELLIRQGQPAERFFLVLKGRVKLYRISADGQEKVVEIIQAGQTFAEAVMFMQRSEYPVCAETLETVQLIRLTTPPMAPPPYNKVAGPLRTSMRSNSSGSVVTAWSALRVEASSMPTPSDSTLTRAPSMPRITGRLAPAPKELPRTPGMFFTVSPRVACRCSKSCEPSSTSEALTICVAD